MYEQYYQLAEKPFRMTADPRYLYLSATHERALAMLSDFVSRGGGLALVTGEAGTGKTIVCRAAVERANAPTFTALMLNPATSLDDLLLEALRAFGVTSREDASGASRPPRADLMAALNGFLAGLTVLGATAVLVVDEAQAVPMEVLAQVPTLAPAAAAGTPALRVILAGQPELAARLEAPELRGLRDSIAVRYQLTALTADETTAYVHHRLAVASAGAAPTFTAGALTRIHGYTGGIPRLINLVCHRALIAGHAADKATIDGDLVRAVLEGLDSAAPPARRRGWLARMRGFRGGAPPLP